MTVPNSPLGITNTAISVHYVYYYGNESYMGAVNKGCSLVRKLIKQHLYNKNGREHFYSNLNRTWIFIYHNKIICSLNIGFKPRNNFHFMYFTKIYGYINPLKQHGRAEKTYFKSNTLFHLLNLCLYLGYIISNVTFLIQTKP